MYAQKYKKNKIKHNICTKPKPKNNIKICIRILGHNILKS